VHAPPLTACKADRSLANSTRHLMCYRHSKIKLDKSYCLRLQMSRLIYECIISPIKALHSRRFEPQEADSQGRTGARLLIAN
jgi:hypothetical protein